MYIYIYIYVCGFCGHRPGSSLASSGRDLDAPKRAWDAPTPKKRMLGLTPAVVFYESSEVDDSGARALAR